METLKTAYGTVSVYLNNIFTTEGNFVHISFVDKKNKTHIVVMQKSLSGELGFDDCNKYPEWILSLKSEFEELIVRNRLNGFHELTVAQAV